MHKVKFVLLNLLLVFLLYGCASSAQNAEPKTSPENQGFSGETPVSPTQTPLPTPETDADVLVTVDFDQPAHPISPLIYGMTGAPVEMMQELNLPLRSWGGNPNSRYNWKLGNAWNSARDWLYTNGDYGYKGESADNDFIRENMEAGAATRLAVPTIGWVAKDTSSCSFPQPDGSCGMAGYATCEKPGEKADPYQTSVEAPPEFIGQWIDQLNSAGLEVEYFAMDNEPDLWGLTHYDVHPECTTYDEILKQFVDYGEVVKSKAPEAKILGPVSCCWYFYWNSMAGKADKFKHKGMDFLPWFLQQMNEYERENGQRLLDVLDIHYYPEGVYNDDASDEIAAQRLRATRSLWDREYKDESWIDEPIYLIPRMRELIDEYYPGTPLALTEWNFGAEETMNGALAIAEALGTFGREQLDIGAYYRHPDAESPGYFAFKMFTNYDSNGGQFGDTSLKTTTSDSDNLSAFGARDTATGRVMIMLVNKNPDRAYETQVLMNGFAPGEEGQVYRYDQSDLSGIRMETLDAGQPLVLDVPAYSISLLVFEPQD